MWREMDPARRKRKTQEARGGDLYAAPSACEGSRLIKRDTLQKAATRSRRDNRTFPAPVRANVHYLPSITHSLLIHLLTLRHTLARTHSAPTCRLIHPLIRALNTRLDASETHLSPRGCVGKRHSVHPQDACGRAVANVIHQVSGQSDPPLNDWLLIRLTGRPPPRCLLPATSSSVIYFHFASLVPPACIPLFLSPVFFQSFHLFPPPLTV